MAYYGGSLHSATFMQSIPACTISAHEYVHIFQNAHNLSAEADVFGLESPIWMEEGAAEFLALYLA